MKPHSITSGGFTLVELMITLAVFGILVAIAVPDFSRTLVAQRTRATANELYTDLYWAKEEAIKRNEDVAITFRSDGWQIATVGGSLLKSYATPTQQVHIAGSTSFSFDKSRGLTSANAVTVSSDAGSVSLSVVALGYADICSNDIGGFRKC
jgi:prepilin-type N-terminal cleavage/methylation domain-containing protein